MTVNIQVPMFHTKKAVVQEKTRSLVILVQILDPFSLSEHLGFDPIPLSRVVNS